MFLVGVILLISDLLPPRFGAALREWSWLGLTVVMVVASVVAIVDAVDVFNRRSRLEANIDLTRESIREVERSLRHYEAAGRVTTPDRELIAMRIAEYEQEVAADAARIAEVPARLVASVILAIVSVGALLLFALLFIDEWRVGAAGKHTVEPGCGEA